MKGATETAVNTKAANETADSKNDEKKTEYTMPGVLHFLEHQATKYEKDRMAWNFERIELMSRIGHLQGQLQTQDELKAFLITRIKMLEACLRKERIDRCKTENEVQALVDSTDEDDGFVAVPVSRNPPDFLAEHRKILGDFTKEMQDIGLFIEEDIKEDLLVRGGDEDDNDEFREVEKPEDLLENSFKFLSTAEKAKQSKPMKISQKMDEYREEMERRVAEKKAEKEAARTAEGGGSPPLEKYEPTMERYMDAVRGNNSSDGPEVEFVWKVKRTLRNHLDAVRAIQFHPLEPLVFTASEDGTVKMWFLGEKGAPLGDFLVPICTMRGHKGAVLSLAIDNEGQTLCSGGADGYICYWNPPTVAEFRDICYGPEAANNSPYEKFSDRSVPTERIEAHQDAVWSLAMAADRLVSASSDGMVRISCVEEPALFVFGPDRAGNPVAVNILPDTDGHIAVAYQNHCITVVSWYTGKTIRSFDFGSEKCTLTAIASHPTLPVTVVASTDMHVRFFDNKDGRMTHSFKAHTDAISCLTIENSQLLITGCHDGSMRVWDFERKICIQEIMIHRKKGDAGVYGIAFHNHYQMIGCAGADGLAKVLLP